MKILLWLQLWFGLNWFGKDELGQVCAFWRQGFAPTQGLGAQHPSFPHPKWVYWGLMKYQGIFIHLKMNFPSKASWIRQIWTGVCLTGHWFFCTPGIEQGNRWNKKRLTLIHAGLVKDSSFPKCFSVPLIWSLQHTWGRNHCHEILALESFDHFAEIPEDSGLRWALVGCNFCHTRELFMLLVEKLSGGRTCRKLVLLLLELVPNHLWIIFIGNRMFPRSGRSKRCRD